MIRIGTSGWVYADWRARFYPRDVPQHRWLEHYTTRFSTVEINNSFYRLPSEKTFEAWYDQTPPGFVFAVKASRFITHIKRLREGREPNELLWSRARILRDRLGPLLYQLPPTFEADLDRLGGFLRTLPATARCAFEFRHPSWYRDEVYALLDDAGVALVLPDTPGARIPEVVTGGWSYVRFHRGTPREPGYTKPKLRRWADRLVAMPAEDVYVYFNNDQQGAAPRDADTLAALLSDRDAAVA